MKRQSFSFIFKGISQEQFAVFPEIYTANGSKSFSINLQYHYAVNERLIGCESIVDFAEQNKIFLRCGLLCGFEIDEDSWKERFNRQYNAVHLAREVYEHFAAFTVGTLRGYLHAMQRDSMVSATLPPVNVVDLLKDFEPYPIEMTDM